VPTLIATTVVIFAAAYLLWAVQRVFFNPVTDPANASIRDLDHRELAVLVPLIAAMVWMGLYPNPLLRRTEAASKHYVELVSPHLPAAGAPVADRPIAEAGR
jgi:NADH-quinone oxidoreductase subunit M